MRVAQRRHVARWQPAVAKGPHRQNQVPGRNSLQGKELPSLTRRQNSAGLRLASTRWQLKRRIQGRGRAIMRAVPIFSLPGSWAALCLAALTSLAANEPKLEVWLSGGRHFSGEADSASSQEQLILRTVSGGITIRRPIDWQTI